MILLDSNIVIYLRDPKLSSSISDALKDRRLCTCNIVIAEVLGFKKLEASDSLYFERLFSIMKNYSFDDHVTKMVIELRRTRVIQLPDAIIAATTLVNDLVLWTHNTADFKEIPGIRLFDPIKSE